MPKNQKKSEFDALRYVTSSGTAESRTTDRHRSMDAQTIGIRWWVDNEDDLHFGWPAPGTEAACAALGWIHAELPIGVIEACDLKVEALRTRLDAAFPGRTWLEGDWHAKDTENATRPYAGKQLA